MQTAFCGCGARTRGNGFKLKEGRFTIDTRNKLFDEGGDTLQQVAQRSCGCSQVVMVLVQCFALQALLYWELHCRRTIPGALLWNSLLCLLILLPLKQGRLYKKSR